MKQIFEEPKMEVIKFSVYDDIETGGVITDSLGKIEMPEIDPDTPGGGDIITELN